MKDEISEQEGEQTAQELQRKRDGFLHRLVRYVGLGLIPVCIVVCILGPWLAGKVEESRRSIAGLGKMHSLKPMRVKLGDDPPRHLRVKIVFEAPDRRAVSALNRWTVQIHESIGTLLESKTFSEVNSPAERKVIKRRIADAVNSITGSPHVSQVYFEEFRLDGFSPIQFFRNPFAPQKGRENHG